ncbi:hypothetical protein D917_09752 [Trichinella nativa]|uniref:Uncharacterized protein n=1 Tax=Trichinella nativa TaxID=6335 RepID=A0A1Y3EFJ5_9BILA|nr:hypothetical protein D917_09752 [Trichinella nativa]
MKYANPTHLLYEIVVVVVACVYLLDTVVDEVKTFSYGISLGKCAVIGMLIALRHLQHFLHACLLNSFSVEVDLENHFKRCSEFLVRLFCCDSVDCFAVVDRDDTVNEEDNFSHLCLDLITTLGLVKLTWSVFSSSA